MLQKLKTKLLPSLGILALAITVLSGMAGSLLAPKTAQAVDYDGSQITLQLDTRTLGANNQFVTDNLIRVGRDVTPQVQGVVTLKSPSQLVLGSDRISANTGGLTINAIGAGVSLTNKCDGPWVSIINATGSNQTYMTCDFTGGSNKTSSGTITANNTSNTVFTINLSNPGVLGLDPTKVGQVQQFMVYPYLDLDNNRSLTVNAGKNVYIVYYNTDAEAKAARDANTRPSGIQGYGSNTGSANLDATGSYIVGFINKFLVAILGLVNEFVYFLFYWLVAPLIQAMLSIHTYTDTFAAVIYPGWEVIRNICNILFIVALIAIALATLFRVESYHFRQLLVQLIMAALLVNFSLAISQAVLGIADTAQNQFLPNNVGVIRSLARDLMVNQTRTDFFDKGVAQLGTFADSVKMLFYVSMSLASFAIFVAIGAFLVVRMVMLWILLMLSPIPYVAGILPATAKFRDQWWGAFIKYAFFTPIMAFLLNIAALISQKTLTTPVLQTVGSQSLYQDLNQQGIAEFVFRVGSNILLLVFLLASIRIAEQFGIAGAHTFTEITQKGMFAPFKPGSLPGAGYVQRKKQELTADWQKGGVLKKAAFFAANPVTVAKAFNERTHTKQHRAEHWAQGAAHDFLNQVPGLREPGPKDLPHARIHGFEDDMKNLGITSEEQGVAYFKDLMSAAKKNPQVRSQAWGTVLWLLENKGGNAMLSSAKAAGFDRDYEWTPEGLMAFMQDAVKKGYIDDETAGDLMSKFTDIGGRTKQLWLSQNFKLEHNHPHLIEMEEDENGKLTTRVKGGNEYRDFRAVMDQALVEEDEHGVSVQDRIDDKYNRILAKSVGKDYDIMDDVQKQDFRTHADEYFKSLPDKQQESINYMMRETIKQEEGVLKAKVVDKIKHDNAGFNEHNLENYIAYKEGQNTRSSNDDKLFAQDRWRSVHYVNYTYIDDQGNTRFSRMGIHRLASLNKGDFSQVDQIDTKKRESMVMASVNRDLVAQDLRQYHQEVTKLKGDALEKRVQADLEKSDAFLAGKKGFFEEKKPKDSGVEQGGSVIQEGSGYRTRSRTILGEDGKPSESEDTNNGD